MSETNRTTAIAQDMVSRVRENKRPYSWLKWVAEVIYEGKEWEAYFAAINILKSANVENVKRSPLTSLSEKERKDFRKNAKRLAISLEKYLKVSVKVERAPIQKYGTDEPRLQISIQRTYCSRFFLYPSFDEVLKFSMLSELQKEIQCYKMADRTNAFCAEIEAKIAGSGLFPSLDTDKIRGGDHQP